ncbi:hypothetical protein U9316_26485, partial [Escherichia coli]
MRQVLNINVGLGSDIPAGHSPSIFEACLHAITASKALNDGGNSQLSSEVWGYSGASVSFREAFWLATGGDGKILDLPIGKLRKDYFVDTIVIDTNGHNLDIIIYDDTGFAPIFPDICYHLTHYKPAAADIPVASDNPAHYADAIRYNAR